MQNRTDETADAPVRRSLRYLRVSSRKQMDTDADIDPEGNSIDTQRKVCQERERELGLVNVDEYVEPGKLSADHREAAGVPGHAGTDRPRA